MAVLHGRWIGAGAAMAALFALGLAGSRQGEGEGPAHPLGEEAARYHGPEAVVPPLAVHAWTFAVEPKAFSPQVERGLAWIVAHQLPNGGWGQGEESEAMGHSLDAMVATADVADTCVAALALVRSGGVAGEGPRGAALARGVAYVCGEVEASDAESLYVSSVRGTRVQMKIGTYVDTFLASMLLSEVKGRMPDAESNERVERALAKVLAKIERNQRADGGFDGSGWAPVLSQSMAGKAINRAAQVGAELAPSVGVQNADYFAKLDEQPAADGGKGVIRGDPGGSAGVALYQFASKLSGLSDFVNTSLGRELELDRVLETTKDEAQRADALEEKGAIGRAREQRREAQGALVARLEDPSFVGGFGSNGGEEFLSYMNVSESLVVGGGEAWKRWDGAVTANLNRVQNEDGSWSGQHCITGRTFVTSAALLTLMADRTPVPVGSPSSCPSCPSW